MMVAFDLDDTLYDERDYAISALKFAADTISSSYGVQDCETRLRSLFLSGDADAIGTVWRSESLPPSEKIQLIDAMRGHFPSIALRADAIRILRYIRERGIGYLIITDGRSVTQRMKAIALGLDDFKMILISEETGWRKPDSRIFTKVENAFPNYQFIYIADNPRKDFLGANRLGWKTIMLRDGGRNIHSQDIFVEESYRANIDVDSLDDVIEILEKVCR